MKNSKLRILAFFLITTMFFMVFTETKANIVPNYTFDTDLSGWGNNWGSSIHETNIVYNGTGSVHVYSAYYPTYYHWGLLSSDPIAVSPSTLYYFRVFGNCTPITGGFDMSLQWYNDGSVVGNEWPSLVTPDGTWQEIKFNYTSPATANNVVIKIGCQSDDNPIDAYFDEVYLDTIEVISEIPIENIGILMLTIGTVMIGAILRKRVRNL